MNQCLCHQSYQLVFQLRVKLSLHQHVNNHCEKYQRVKVGINFKNTKKNTERHLHLAQVQHLYQLKNELVLKNH